MHLQGSGILYKVIHLVTYVMVVGTGARTTILVSEQLSILPTTFSPSCGSFEAFILLSLCF